MRHSFIVIIAFLLISGVSRAQEINFGKYATEGIVLTNESIHSGGLDFGQVVEGEGTVSINLTNPEVVVFSIEAEIDKDVFVTFTPPDKLVYDANNKMSYTFKAAYSNKGSNNITQARIISGTSVRFPVLARENKPPSPPPTPNDNEYTTPTTKAYLYIYGDLNVTNTEDGSLAAGLYTGTIDISVSYEDQN